VVYLLLYFFDWISELAIKSKNQILLNCDSIYEPQGKSTDATIGEEWIVVVKIAIERWKERRIRSIQALRVSQLET